MDYLIRSRYEEVECAYCGATVTIDLDAGAELAAASDPLDHEDDCERALVGRPLIEVLADDK